MAQVSIRQLHKHYGSHHALKGVDLEIPSGSFFTLLGPSGCGKTTLLRAIAGFHMHDGGDILVEGRSFGHSNASERKVGMVFQDYAVFPHLSVFDNVAFGLVQQKVARSEIGQRVNEMLVTVQLSGLADRMPHQLSGGQQQRVGLARALVIRPKILLMDEPLSNLDAKLRIELRQDIKRMQQQLALTTIYVTHDQEEALSVSDLVCVMEGGEVQQVGRPWDIYHHPVNRFAASFVGANNFSQLTVKKGHVQWLGQSWELPQSAHGQREVILALRPEKLRVNAGGNGVAAKVLHTVFTGREMQLLLQFGDAQNVEALVAPNEAMVALKQGDAVFVEALQEDLRWFAADARGAQLQ